MKFHSLLLFALFILATGCNKIEPPFTENTAAKGIDTVAFSEKSDTIQRILIEDFTGHTCGNCPAAAKIALQIQTNHPEQIVIMGLHVSEQFAAPLNDGTGHFTYDFRTPEGTEIDQHFGASNAGLPRGMVNRKNFNGTKILDRNDWTSAVQPLLSVKPSIDLKVKAYFSANTDSVAAYIQTKFFNNYSGDVKLCAFVVEDSIINWQSDYSKPPGQNKIENYVHRHNLRAAFIGAYGEILTKTNFMVNDKFKNGFVLKKGSDWVSKNLSVVAYLYKTDSEEIIQVAETKVVLQ
jgi:hypothetical protein